jgi:hypothetical protein
MTEDANRNAPVPPGFGEGKPWVLRVVEYETVEGRFVVLAQNGMPVADRLHGFYQAELQTYGDLIAAGVKLSNFAILDEAAGRIVAASRLDPTDGPDEIAWLSCMFQEIGLGSIVFELPEGIDLSAVRGGRLGVVVGKEVPRE